MLSDMLVALPAMTHMSNRTANIPKQRRHRRIRQVAAVMAAARMNPANGVSIAAVARRETVTFDGSNVSHRHP